MTNSTNLATLADFMLVMETTLQELTRRLQDHGFGKIEVYNMRVGDLIEHCVKIGPPETVQ